MQKINIELTPFHALIFVKLFCEIQETGTISPVAKDAINEFGVQLSGKMTQEHIDEAALEAEVQKLIGRCPKP